MDNSNIDIEKIVKTSSIILSSPIVTIPDVKDIKRKEDENEQTE